MMLVWCRTCGAELKPVDGHSPDACLKCGSKDVRELGIYDVAQETVSIDTSNIHLVKDGQQEA